MVRPCRSSPVACPRCGARLISKTAERPPRLLCANCGALLPQKPPTPAWVWMQGNLLRLLLLSVLVLLPLIVITISAPLERSAQQDGWKLGRLTTGRSDFEGRATRPQARERGASHHR